MHRSLLFLALLPVLSAAPETDSEESSADDTKPKVSRWMPGYLKRSEWTPLTGAERKRFFAEQAVLSPVVYLRSFGSAVFNHTSNRPPEWGQGAEGYFHRVGDRFGRFALQDVITHGSAAILQHEIRYVQCQCTGFLPRFGRAFSANFVTLNKSGSYAPNYPFMLGSVGGEAIGNMWWPDRTRTVSTVVRGIGLQFSTNTALNVLREFSPEIKRALRMKK